uniref:Uncharacterized protein n=1 Tax=Rhizophora mucronata TaxID=61149 RepID=A0A2P2N0X4_RHIMU
MKADPKNEILRAAKPNTMVPQISPPSDTHMHLQEIQVHINSNLT